MAKYRASISIDYDIWNLFTKMYPQKASGILENFMRGMTLTNTEINEDTSAFELEDKLRVELQDAQASQIRAKAIQLELGKRQKVVQDAESRAREERSDAVSQWVKSGGLHDLGL